LVTNRKKNANDNIKKNSRVATALAAIQATLIKLSNWRAIVWSSFM